LASTQEEAAAAVYTCTEDDPSTVDVDESGCTGANPEDLATGCNEGAWQRLVTASDALPELLEGTWMEVVHEDKLPRSFTPPEGTTRVEIGAIISGHGFGDSEENCAEFCDHQHQWWVNGAEAAVMDQPMAGTRMGCADQVEIGTIPNQAGTWVYGRGGWCPGLEVPVRTQDITDMVTIGGDNELGYLGLFEDEVYYPSFIDGGSWSGSNVILKSFVVYYE
jgi:hypothetical protein